MKKVYKIIVALIIITVVALFTIKYEENIKDIENNIKYSYINNKNKKNNNNYLKDNIENIKDIENYDLQSKYNVESDNFYDLSFNELKDLFEKNSTFILYVGFPYCPWCEELIPELVEVNKKYNYNIFVWDISIEQAKSDKKYEDKLEELKKYIGDYYNIKNNDIQKIVVPKVFFIKNGMIQYVHEYTTPDHNAKERKMTEEEKEKVRNSLDEGFKRITSDKNYNFKRNKIYE